jgi:V8-like Glu-specific endopeptidase
VVAEALNGLRRSMADGWTWPIARLQRANGIHVGAGVLVAGDLVLTCAHVVEDALRGTAQTPGKEATLEIAFPFADIHGLAAKVAAWFPPIQEADRRPGGSPTDLAVITLDNPERVETIEPCLIAETDPRAGVTFSCQGFPAGYPQGAPARGVLQGTDAGGWTDAVADSGFGHFIEPGFSGTPVFIGRDAEVRGGEVIGLCVTADIGDKRVARLIPPAQLAFAIRSVSSPYRWLEPFSQRDAA